MTTVKEFLARVKDIDGVEGCLMVRADGHLLGHLVKNPEELSSILTISARYARGLMDKAGFSYFRLLSFERAESGGFHIFPVDQYYLGVVQSPEFPLASMTEKVTKLLSLVKTSSSKNTNTNHNMNDGHGTGL